MSEKGEKEAGRPRRRRFQFSLGSMLLLMTVFGVWFGIRMDRARRQERAVAALGERGGVSYDSAFPNMHNPKRFVKKAPYGPKWLRAIVGDDFFDRVRAVFLYESTTDFDLEKLKDLPDVESVIISSTQVTDAGVAQLRHLPDLKELILSCQMTDAGLTHLQTLRELRYLLVACPITDKRIPTLDTLEKLETLEVVGADGMSSACRRAAAELESPSQIEIIEEPLCSVCDCLANFHGIDVPIVEEAAVVDGRKAREVPITVKLDKVPLTTVLDAMLKDTGLDWILTQKGILITTKEKAADRLAAVRELQRRLPSLKKVVCVVEP